MSNQGNSIYSDEGQSGASLVAAEQDALYGCGVSYEAAEQNVSHGGHASHEAAGLNTPQRRYQKLHKSCSSQKAAHSFGHNNEKQKIETIEDLIAAVKSGNLHKLECESLHKSNLKNLLEVKTGELKDTILHIATRERKSDLSIIKYLCEQGANVNAKNIDHNTPLHIAAAGGDLDRLRYLYETAGADIDNVNISGRTCLHIAVFGYKCDVVEYLLSHTPINRQLKDEDKKTAEDIARCSHSKNPDYCPNMVDLFTKHTN